MVTIHSNYLICKNLFMLGMSTFIKFVMTIDFYIRKYYNKNRDYIILGGKGMRKGNTVIINGRLINLEKVTIEELDEIKKELEKKEKFIREQIDQLLAEDE